MFNYALLEQMSYKAVILIIQLKKPAFWTNYSSS